MTSWQKSRWGGEGRKEEGRKRRRRRRRRKGSHQVAPWLKSRDLHLAGGENGWKNQRTPAPKQQHSKNNIWTTQKTPKQHRRLWRKPNHFQYIVPRNKINSFWNTAWSEMSCCCAASNERSMAFLVEHWAWETKFSSVSPLICTDHETDNCYQKLYFLQHVASAFLVLLSRIQTHPNQSSVHPLNMFPPTCLQNEVDPLPVKLFPALHDGPKVIVKRPWFYTMSQKSLKKWLGPKFGKINHISLLLFPPQFATGFPENQS